MKARHDLRKHSKKNLDTSRDFQLRCEKEHKNTRQSIFKRNSLVIIEALTLPSNGKIKIHCCTSLMKPEKVETKKSKNLFRHEKLKQINQFNNFISDSARRHRLAMRHLISLKSEMKRRFSHHDFPVAARQLIELFPLMNHKDRVSHWKNFLCNFLFFCKLLAVELCNGRGMK